jgi:hypothetical protein
MKKVPFNKENAMKCICGNCPVQIQSECSAAKAGKIKEMMEKAEEKMPPSDEVPGLYCASGIAACEDLETDKVCICMQCPLWAEYDLSSGLPVGYYCRDGEAQ